MIKIYINIDSLRVSIDVNGPGKRLVLWVQGCTLGCKGCFNTEFWPHQKNKLIEIKELEKIIMKQLKQLNCKGLTISGGEPLQQSKVIARIVNKVKSSGYTVIIFTGYTIDEIKLSNIDSINEIISSSDVLICGRYNQANNQPNQSWNNNTDKELWFITDAYVNYPIETKQIEITLKDNYIYWTGFPNDLEINKLLK